MVYSVGQNSSKLYPNINFLSFVQNILHNPKGYNLTMAQFKINYSNINIYKKKIVCKV